RPTGSGAPGRPGSVVPAPGPPWWPVPGPAGGGQDEPGANGEPLGGDAGGGPVGGPAGASKARPDGAGAPGAPPAHRVWRLSSASRSGSRIGAGDLSADGPLPRDD